MSTRGHDDKHLPDEPGRIIFSSVKDVQQEEKKNTSSSADAACSWGDQDQSLGPAQSEAGL